MHYLELKTHQACSSKNVFVVNNRFTGLSPKKKSMPTRSRKGKKTTRKTQKSRKTTRKSRKGRRGRGGGGRTVGAAKRLGNAGVEAFVAPFRDVTR